MTGAERARLTRHLRRLRRDLLPANDRWLAAVEAGDYLAALAAMQRAGGLADEVRQALVDLARAEGATWQEIADAFGWTLTRAYRHFSRTQK